MEDVTVTVTSQLWILLKNQICFTQGGVMVSWAFISMVLGLGFIKVKFGSFWKKKIT